jgi:hypothetical protein
MSNPVDDYIESCSEKTAADPSYGSQLAEGVGEAFGGRQTGRLLGAAGIVGGATLLVSAAHKAYMAATKSKHHKEMLEVNPDLAEHQQADPKMFNQHYNSLRNMNPRFAQDPVVAGAYMRRMSEFPHNAGPILVESMRDQPQTGGVKDFSTAVGLAQRAAVPEPQG